MASASVLRVASEQSLTNDRALSVIRRFRNFGCIVDCDFHIDEINVAPALQQHCRVACDNESQMRGDAK